MRGRRTVQNVTDAAIVWTGPSFWFGLREVWLFENRRKYATEESTVNVRKFETLK